VRRPGWKENEHRSACAREGNSHRHRHERSAVFAEEGAGVSALGAVREIPDDLLEDAPRRRRLRSLGGNDEADTARRSAGAGRRDVGRGVAADLGARLGQFLSPLNHECECRSPPGGAAALPASPAGAAASPAAASAAAA
jgi:hypothetical protein